MGARMMTAVDTTWRDRAGCRFAEPTMFFPAGASGATLDVIETAKAVCQACPVRTACLDFALDTNQESGIWGGVTEDERRKLRRAWLADRRRRQAG